MFPPLLVGLGHPAFPAHAAHFHTPAPVAGHPAAAPAGGDVLEGGIEAPRNLCGLFASQQRCLFEGHIEGVAGLQEYAIPAAGLEAVVDLSSRFRLDQMVPLVVPEVNPDALANWRAIVVPEVA